MARPRTSTSSKALASLALLAGACAVAEDGGPGLRFATDPVLAVDISHWEGPTAFAQAECWWAEGVRHVISGTQREEVTRQQLAMALRRGFSIDAYVYLYWTADLREQVREAFRRVEGLPIGRMWLDVEELADVPPPAALAALLRDALDECRSFDRAECGIYTGDYFWIGKLGNTTEFADAPLWYALYNDRHDLSAWPQERFGGWLQPAAKQWDERALCGVGVDQNAFIPNRAPEVVVDRTPAPPPVEVPPAPVGHWPADFHRTDLVQVMLTVDSIPHADRYEFRVERWRGAGWSHFFTFSRSESFKEFDPVVYDSLFRFSVRARNPLGWGAWSPPAEFEVGHYTGARPEGWGQPPAVPPDGGVAPAPLDAAAGTLDGPAPAGETGVDAASP